MNALTVAVIGFILGIIGLFGTFIALGSHGNRSTLGAIIGIAIVVIGITLGIIGITVQETAKVKGAYDLTDISFTEMIEHNANTPDDQSAQMIDEPRQLIVYLYRYSCPDCEALHDEIYEWLDSSPWPYLSISSKSDVGIRLKERYNVDKVPAIIVFDNTGQATSRVIYQTDENGNAVLNESALNLLSELM